MNTPRPPHPVDERDWLAQERTLASAGGDRRDALLARALRTLPVSQPPPGFAAGVARLAASRAGTAVADDPRLERMMLNVLLVVMVLSVSGVVALYGGQWWSLSVRALGGAAAQLALAGAACLALSWAMSHGRRLLEASRAHAHA